MVHLCVPPDHGQRLRWEFVEFAVGLHLQSSPLEVLERETDMIALLCEKYKLVGLCISELESNS